MKQVIEQKLAQGRKGLFDSDELSALAIIEDEMQRGARAYLEKNSFININPPHLTKASGACENIMTVFPTFIGDKDAYLSQTGQLYLEAFIGRFDKTYCIGSSFRREEQVDNRHLCEFSLLEIEHKGDMNILKKNIEWIIGSIVSAVQTNCINELDVLGVDMKKLEQLMPPYNSMTYTEAISLLPHLKWGADLTSQDEKILVEINDNKPIYVTHYPENIKFFNMKLNRENPQVVNSGDLLMPYSGEAVGSAERENDYTILVDRFKKSAINRLMSQTLKMFSREGKDIGITAPQDEDAYSRSAEIFAVNHDKNIAYEVYRRFEWYFDIVKNNPVNHAGCGIGMSRVAQSILQSKDIRASTLYPINTDMIL